MQINHNQSILRRIINFWRIEEESYMTSGVKIFLTFFFVLFTWACFAPINSSIIANGEIILTANKKIISHLEGGIIEEIKVAEGQFVETNQSLITLSTIQVKSKIKQVKEAIHASEFQKTATQKRIATLKQELQIVNELLRSSNSSLTRKLDLQKQLHESEGKLGEIISNIASLESEYRANNDILDRSDIKAPVSGFIMNLKHQTVGGIISPASEIMYIVPKDESMIAEVKVKPQDIDLLSEGMEAKIQLSAYKSKLMPKLDGKVVTVSADSFKNEMTGEIYFKARISIPESEMEKLNTKVKLTPGMPVVSFIITGSRTLMQYLASPISDSTYKAFREE